MKPLKLLLICFFITSLGCTARPGTTLTGSNQSVSTAAGIVGNWESDDTCGENRKVVFSFTSGGTFTLSDNIDGKITGEYKLNDNVNLEITYKRSNEANDCIYKNSELPKTFTFFVSAGEDNLTLTETREDSDGNIVPQGATENWTRVVA